MIEAGYLDGEPPICEGCDKPILRGQFIQHYTDVGAVHLNCQEPFTVPMEGGTIMVGAPLIYRTVENSNTCEMPEAAAMRYIEQLRADAGDTITICCDNPEATYKSEQLAIDCNGQWTEFKDRRFLGESVLQCLAKAVSARSEP